MNFIFICLLQVRYESTAQNCIFIFVLLLLFDAAGVLVYFLPLAAVTTFLRLFAEVLWLF